jgi:RING finger protein 113A
VASSSKSEVVLPSRKAAANLLSAGTKRTISQRDGYDDPDAPEKDGPDVKWTAEGSHVNAALDILAGDEAEELLAKRRRKERADAGEEEEIPDDGQYRGQGAYHSHLKKSSEVPKAMRVGPQRSTSTIRTVTIVDYQPDVCKDYKGMFPPFSGTRTDR